MNLIESSHLWEKQSFVPKRDIERSKPFFYNEQQKVNQDENITLDEDEPMDVDTKSLRLQASNIFDNFYAKSVILEIELSCH